MLTDAIRLIVFPALMAFAASSDLFTMTISNRVTLALVGGFVAMACLSGMSPSEMLIHAGAAAMVLAVTFVFFARGWIGGGDAKLAAAIALWFGFDHLVVYLLYASIFGGVLTLVMIRFRLMPLPQTRDHGTGCCRRVTVQEATERLEDRRGDLGSNCSRRSPISHGVHQDSSRCTLSGRFGRGKKRMQLS